MLLKAIQGLIGSFHFDTVVFCWQNRKKNRFQNLMMRPKGLIFGGLELRITITTCMVERIKCLKCDFPLRSPLGGQLRPLEAPLSPPP